MEASYQGNELFFGIFLLREMSQKQSLNIRRRERVLLRHTTVRRSDGIGSRFFPGHCDARYYRLFLQRRTQSNLKLRQPEKRSLSIRQAKTRYDEKLRFRAAGGTGRGENVRLRRRLYVCGLSMGRTRDLRIREPSRTGNPAWLRSPAA
jgi:hypothetical protein